ncbi:uncharacterized protein BX663DRAFT_553587 [Cokeromyces recurvatus]|uniref:uncharacterized protein n=1 Tax=Cokeromyces recurvatus TaxID=90255 RepID=UPI00221FF4BB|nr:uncharacterized protein BX663DRAFT_553587 [Cokeromyces recurvatus]KAI7900942.1 hypothetical protein BX663DRAFT_553587 [Cokeromyces recurvatus]
MKDLLLDDSLSTLILKKSKRTFIRRSSHQRHIPAFLYKLYNMVEDNSTNQYIQWCKEGTSFVVYNDEEFATNILPHFYKHKTFSSFIRQLNMYNFRKIPRTSLWQFENPFFKRGQPDLLASITRKRKSQQTPLLGGDDDLKGILKKELNKLKEQQTNMLNKLKTLQGQRQMVWKERMKVYDYQQRHQQVISKILQFLTTLVVFSNQHHIKNVLAADHTQAMLGQQAHPFTNTTTSTLMTDNVTIQPSIVTNGYSSSSSSCLDTILYYTSPLNQSFINAANTTYP